MSDPSTTDIQNIDSVRASPGAHCSIIRSITVRVAGAVTTEAFAHHYGTSAQQVGVRAGDTLTYVHTHDAAVALARVFSDAAARSGREGLRFSVSQTWLGVEPGTCPPTVLLRHVDAPATTLGYQPRRAISGQAVPAHVWIRVGPVLWQVCDRVAADRLALVWSSAARLLAPPQPATPAHSASTPRDPQHSAEEPSRSAEATLATRPFDRNAAAHDPRPDGALLTAYVDGDPEALATLVVRRNAWVTAAVRRVLGARGDVEDTVQNVWTNVARSAYRFEGRASVATWLWRTAHNAALTALRTDRPTAPLDLDTREVQGAAPDDIVSAILIRDLLAGLPAPQRAAIELVDMQGYDISGAAALLGVAEGTVKSRCARGRDALAVAWARHEHGKS